MTRMRTRGGDAQYPLPRVLPRAASPLNGEAASGRESGEIPQTHTRAAPCRQLACQ